MNKLLPLIIGIGLLTFVLSTTGCDFKEKKKERITAAGHPDEMKDSTRLDPKPVFDPDGLESDSISIETDSLSSE